MVPGEVKNWLEEHNHGTIQSSRMIGGGCINNGQVITADSGKTFFLKTNLNSPADMFEQEARGLRELKQDGGPVVPEVYLSGSTFLLLEDLSPGKRKINFWENFGHQLANLHSVIKENFGFDEDNYIGSTPQRNGWMEDGYAFFAENRLIFQSRLARKQGLLTQKELVMVEKLSGRLWELIPEQPASLLHGDLWGGNVINNIYGDPAVIDPAVYYGWAESELAMTALFGSFPESFYASYREIRPLDPGFVNRYPIYNLYHLLNHLNIFGHSYHGQVRAILNRYAGT